MPIPWKRFLGWPSIRQLSPTGWLAALSIVLAIPAFTPAAAQSPQERALSLLHQMTLEEKIDMMHGEVNPGFAFYNAPIDRLGIPALTMTNGPSGNGESGTQIPSYIALAATWDVAVVHEAGRIAGLDAYSNGNNVYLNPAVDLARVPQWGRLEGTFGEDPLLVGVMATGFVQGLHESPMISTVKHFLAYTQEFGRLTKSDMVMDERTMQEMYVRPFTIVLPNAQPGAVMCSFNQVNGAFACENEMILTQILKTQLAFPGWVMTDYTAQFETVPAVMAGLDQDMPGSFEGQSGPYPYPNPDDDPSCRFCEPLLAAVESGQVPESRIDDAVLRILSEMFKHGLFDQPPTIQEIPIEEHGAAARQMAEKAIVLLKNDVNALPVADVTSIAVIGPDADTIVAPGGSGLVHPTYEVSPLEAIRARAGTSATVDWLDGSDPVTAVAYLPGPNPVPSDFVTPATGEGQGLRAEYFMNPSFSGAPSIDRVEPYAGINGGFFIYPGLYGGSPDFPQHPPELNSNDVSIRWTGALTAPVAGDYQLSLTSNGTSRLFVDEALVASTEPVETVDEINTQTATLTFEAASVHTIRIEYVNDAPSGTDSGPQLKFGWVPPEGVVAPQAQAAADLARGSDVAIVFVRDYGGEGGDKSTLQLPNGQVQVIQQVAAANPRTIVVLRDTGAVNTSDWEASVPAILQAWYAGQEQGNAIAAILWGDVNPSGKLPITMPIDETQSLVSTPEQYPGVAQQSIFSEGIFLGYRGYEERGLQPSFPFGHGLSYTTFQYTDLTASQQGNPLISLVVQNTGAMAGTETVQVYVGELPTDQVDTASKVLAGWAKVTLQPGESRVVFVELSPESLSYWDVDSDQWVMPTGTVPIMVGSSAADIRLTGALEVTADTQRTLEDVATKVRAMNAAR